MSKFTDDLTARLAATAESGLDAGLLVPLLRLLSDGVPVEVEELAVASGRSADAVRQGLAAVPDTEYDDAGRVVGQGLTLRPTVHRFSVDGRELYTWCALDTLMFPALIGRPAAVESVCHATGRPVRLRVEPERVTAVEPSTAVVSVVSPEDLGSLRSSFCNQVHFFESAEEARPWLADHPGAEVLGIAEAHRLGRAMVARLLHGPTDDGPGSADEPSSRF